MSKRTSRSGRSWHERRHGPHRDVHLVGRRQAAGIDQPQRTVRPERAMGMGGRIESLERRAVDDDRDLVGRHAQPDESVAHRLVDGQRRRREGDRQPLLEEEQAVGDRVRGLREAASEELRHGFVQVQDDRHADEAQRERREHEVVRQRGHLGQGEPLAPMGPDRRPAGRRTRKSPYSARYVQRLAPWWRWTSSRRIRTPFSSPSASSPGRRRPRTRTGRPEATTASASRRTRGSSS